MAKFCQNLIFPKFFHKYTKFLDVQTQQTVSKRLLQNCCLTDVKKFSSTEKIFPTSSTCANRSIDGVIFKRYYSKMLKSFEEHQVVPDVIEVAPTELLNVCYGDVQAAEGNVLTPTQVKDVPELSWNSEQSEFYVICMTDPDAPSRSDPKFREWHHWLIGNVPGCRVASGEILSAYIGSGPPKGTGLHRYVFLVYRQKCKLQFDECRLPNNSDKGRANFKISEFAKKYNLGNPIAGNFFQAEWDDYVPKLYEQLSGK